MVNILVRCCNPAMVNTAEGALHLATVDNHIDVGMLGYRFGVILDEVSQLPVYDKILVTVILGDSKTEFAVRARRESPGRSAIADLMAMWTY